MSVLLDVCLRGTRSYIQGSQMLAKAAEWLVSEGFGAAVLTSAKFSKLTNRKVMLQLDNEPAPPNLMRLGMATYGTGAGTLNVQFLEHESACAPRCPEQPSRISSYDSCGAGVGYCRFATDGTHESYLAAVVEILKKQQAGLAAHVEEIWFTALSNAELQIAPTPPLQGGLKASLLLSRAVNGRFQTLSRVETELPTGSIEIQPFQVSFACVIREE